MSRLDPNGADFDPEKKTVTSFGPTANDLQHKMEGDAPMSQGNIKTAASYSERVKTKQAATGAIKQGGKPLGGALPLPEDKMRQISEGLAPRPTFDDEPTRAPSPKRRPQEPPQSVGGVGSGYQVNQEMARGNIDRPVSMREAKKMGQETKPGKEGERIPLSQDTIDDLEAMNAAAERGDLELQEPDVEAELEDAEQAMLNSDKGFNLDFAGIEEARLTMVSPKRRKAIEEGLEPLSIADMVTKREIKQIVPIIANQLSYTFRTFNQHEHLHCLQYVFNAEGSQAYSEELLNTAKLVCSLVAINGAPLPEHREHIGTAKEVVGKESFETKLFHVASFPTQMIADMSAQAIWFTDRVNQLFSLDNLKNG